MKYLITAKPGMTPIPPDQGAAILKATRAWIQAKLGDGSLDVTCNFFGGGGMAIANASTHEECLKNLIEIPIYPFFNWEVHPILDLEESYDMYIASYEKLGST